MIAVVAYGNTLRKDDGAGFVLGKKVTTYFKQLNIPVMEISTHQIVPELIYDLMVPEIDRIVFVDARWDDVDQGVCVVPVAPKADTKTMGHNLSPSLFVAMLHRMSSVLQPAWLLSVPGWDFGFGEGLSLATRQAILDFGKKIDIHMAPIIYPKSNEGRLQCSQA